MKLSFTSAIPSQLVADKTYICGKVMLVDQIEWAVYQYHDGNMVNQRGTKSSLERFIYAPYEYDYLIFDIKDGGDLLCEPHHTESTMSNEDIVRELCRVCNCKPDQLRQVVPKSISMDRCFCDKPEDRLYHHSDHTWWRRTADGNLISADPPVGWVQSTD